jgi:hypothetical protein
MREVMADARRVCLETYRTVLETVMLLPADGHANTDAIRELFNCAEICQATASLLRAGDPRALALCAEVCERTAASCPALGDDPRLLACADACRQCAERCADLAAVAAVAA